MKPLENYPSCPADVVADAIEEWLANRCFNSHSPLHCSCPSTEDTDELVDAILKGLGDLNARRKDV